MITSYLFEAISGNAFPLLSRTCCGESDGSSGNSAGSGSLISSPNSLIRLINVRYREPGQ